MEIYAVVWSTGSCDDHGNAKSFNGLQGIYKSDAAAKKALVECKDEVYQEALEDLAGDEDTLEFEDKVRVYGSENEGYFEIDYTLGTEPVEIYIQIVNSFVQE